MGMKSDSSNTLRSVLASARACNVCAPFLPLGPRPVLQVASQARILIVGQAPGAKVHDTGVPWNDASGKRLREWLGVTPEVFYDARHFALIPMGFCYPGRGKSGDNPPRPECAPLWMDKLLAYLRRVELTLLIGQYAQAHFLGGTRKATLTETVAAWREYEPAARIPLPHPSPRNQIWLKRNAWFEAQTVPALRARVAALL
ncbi:MAG TPA: uracil-DNA glycosylase family protein [Paraburkholderia sp.]|nr:uracil-DNA glycosylase family protein [Paraburkholderia sp.]